MLGRRQFLATLAASATTLPAPASQQAAARKPNLVILFADDLGYGEMGFQGNREIPTPHTDSIANAGVRFTQGYVSAPYCCPSRAGLVTGRYQTRFGHEMNAVGKTNLDPKVGLPHSEKTIAEYLKAAGYVTGIVGKWHLGGTEPFHPLKRGFDEFYGFLHEGHFFYPPPYRGAVTRLREKEPPYDDNNPVMRGTEPIVEPEYLTDAFAREAVSFIERHKDRPFFLYLPFNAIHSPMQAPVPGVKAFEETIKGEQRRVFAAMLKSMDDAIGKVLEKIRSAGLEENTLIVFLSDNGGPTAELTSSNLPLRGGKGQLFEGGIRIPFAMQWKGRIRPGQTVVHPVISLDLLPTAVAAAGAPVPSKLDGVNLLPLVTGQSAAPPHETLFWRYGRNLALRQGKWKLVRQNSAEFQLFDLESDPSETQDLSATVPRIAAMLRKELERMNAQMAPPLWGRVN